MESKASIGHYLEAVRLMADERAIIEGSLANLEEPISKLDDVPTLDGRTPSQIEAKRKKADNRRRPKAPLMYSFFAPITLLDIMMYNTSNNGVSNKSAALQRFFSLREAL